MRKNCFINLSFLFLIFQMFPAVVRAQPLALIYKDKGSCFACEVGAKAAAEAAGMRTEYVAADEITPSLLKRADLWIQPGGDAIDVAKTVNPKVLGYLRDYIGQGGRYLGFCAGAFFADYFVDNDNKIPGLGLIPGGVTKDYIRGGGGAHVFPIRWYRGGQTFIRQLFFGDGPVFEFERRGTVDVIGEYARDGRIAIVQFPFGRGNVVLSAVHPEVPAWALWYYGLEDADGPDQDLAVELIDRTLGRFRPIEIEDIFE